MKFLYPRITPSATAAPISVSFFSQGRTIIFRPFGVCPRESKSPITKFGVIPRF